jgi:pilus assembly protein CpaF
MRPDRLVVGECRGAEIVDLLTALNTGHEGGAGTLHANGSADVPARLEALGLLGGVPRDALHAQVAAALQVVVHLRRTPEARVVEEICLLLPAGTRRLVIAVPAWRRGVGPGPSAAALERMLAERGVAVEAPPHPPADEAQRRG